MGSYFEKFPYSLVKQKADLMGKSAFYYKQPIIKLVFSFISYMVASQVVGSTCFLFQIVSLIIDGAKMRQLLLNKTAFAWMVHIIS